MGGRDSPRPDDDLATMADGVAAVRAPSDPGVSSSHPSDSDLETPKIESGPDSPTLIDGLPAPPLKRVSPAGSGFSSQSSSLLSPGAVLGQRYVILQVLGQGGMGAVYKARDREVDRVVALKVIRPDLAGNAAIIDRFKQELVLSHQVTHKNVVRIYDLGEADGVKFITMEYIEGKDLRTLIQETKAFSPEEAVEIMRQVCRALEAAHAVGVIHRDLKPQNIMRDNQGRVVVMDFGLARSLDSNDGMTQTGAVIGTMEYMSPEQGLGKQLDQRSDLFTVGLIFYELLTGKMPYKSDSALASLLKRTQERAAPVSQHNSKIPSALSNIVAKCLEPDLKTRYQHVVEVLTDLEAWQGKDAAVSLQFPAVKPWAQTVPWTWIGAVAAVLVLAVVGFFYARSRSGASSAQHPAVTLLVADFDNQTSDAVFDGTLEPTFNLALESASFINSFSRGQAHTVAAQLHPGATALDEPLARLVAVREGIGAIIAGSVSRNGNGFKITSKAIDAVTGKTIAEAESEADNKEDVLRSVGKLAAHIRGALGDTTPESVQLAKAETYSSGSLEAAHEYAFAQNLHDAGKFQDSIAHYSRAIELDPDMGRAYAGRAATIANLGHKQESLKDYQMAMARIDRMTDREKYRTRGGYYLLVREPKKAIEEFSALVKQFPFDDAGYSNLAVAYSFMHDMGKALEEGRHAVEISPNEILGRINFALYAIYAGDFEAGIKGAHAIQQLDPNNPYLYRVLAMAQLGEGKIADATESYGKLAALGTDNASVSALGTADIALYQGKVSEAIPNLEKGIAADIAQKDPASAATKLVALAYANWLGGHDTQAVAAADRAVALDKETNVLFAAGRIYVDAGQTAKALSLASQLSGSIEFDPQLFGKLLEGEARLKRGEAKNAIQLFQAAQSLADTWLGHFDLGRAYLDAGLFTEADSELETCLKRDGEASAVFFDELPTFRLVPPVYYYLGRAQEGLKSPAAKDSYRKFVNLQEQGTGPLLADALHRLTSN
jgi:serine/threonine protein kinase/tetratricopeptide (TPR) repeat protein